MVTRTPRERLPGCATLGRPCAGTAYPNFHWPSWPSASRSWAFAATAIRSPRSSPGEASCRPSAGPAHRPQRVPGTLRMSDAAARGNRQAGHRTRQGGQGKAPVLVLAAGDLTFGSVLQSRRREGRTPARVVACRDADRCLERLRFAAVTPGPADLGQAPDVTTPLLKRSKFPWLAENLERPRNGGLRSRAGARRGRHQGGRVWARGPLPCAASSGRRRAGSQARRGRAQDRRSAACPGRAHRRRAAVGRSQSARERSPMREQTWWCSAASIKRSRSRPPCRRQGHRDQRGLSGTARSSRWTSSWMPRAPGTMRSEWTLREAQKDLEQDASELEQKIAAWSKDNKVKASDLGRSTRAPFGTASGAQGAQCAELQRSLVCGAGLRASPDVKGRRRIAKQIDAYDRRVNDHNGTLVVAPVPAPEGTATTWAPRLARAVTPRLMPGGRAPSMGAPTRRSRTCTRSST